MRTSEALVEINIDLCNFFKQENKILHRTDIKWSFIGWNVGSVS